MELGTLTMMLAMNEGGNDNGNNIGNNAGEHPRKAVPVVDPCIGEGGQGEDVPDEADDEDDGQVEDEGHPAVPDGLGHAVLLLPSNIGRTVRGGASECVEAMLLFRELDEPVR